MSTTRPFAYNTGSTISGIEQVGNLVIGIQEQDYSANIGGVKWWMGPDEDLGYVIAHQTVSGNQPNPLGIPAYVGFWRTSGKTEESFIGLSNWVADGTTAFTTGDQAKIWLNNNGYWTSFSAISVSDAIYDSLSLSAKTAYTAATVGNFISVSITDYNNVVNDVLGTNRYGTTEIQMSGVSSTSWGGGFAIQNPYQTPVPINNYIIGFSIWPDRASSNILYSGSVTGASTTYTKIGNTVTNNSGGRQFYIRKTPQDYTTGNTYFAGYTSGTQITKGSAIVPTYYKSAGGTTVTPTWSTWNGNTVPPAFQVIATSTKSW
jgi:hypothetical protein